MKKYLVFLLLICLSVNASELKFDFEGERGETAVGFQKVTPDTTFTRELGYGFVKSEIPLSSYNNSKGSLLKNIGGDGITGSGKSTFKVHVTGEWQLWLGIIGRENTPQNLMLTINDKQAGVIEVPQFNGLYWYQYDIAKVDSEVNITVSSIDAWNIGAIVLSPDKRHIDEILNVKNSCVTFFKPGAGSGKKKNEIDIKQLAGAGVVGLLAGIIIMAIIMFLSRGKKQPAAPKVVKAPQQEEDVYKNRSEELGQALSLAGQLMAEVVSELNNIDKAIAANSDVLKKRKSTLLGMNVPESLQAAKADLLNHIDSVITFQGNLRNEMQKNRNEIESKNHEIQKLRSIAEVDALTEVANRMRFDHVFKDAMTEFKENATSFSLLVIDIDFFKKVNDRYGHLAGDRVLKGVARVLKSNLREEVCLARYGGEEFAIILGSSSQSVVVDIAERMRQSVAQACFRIDDYKLKVTISVGCAIIKENEIADSIFKRCDEALYKAKESGRNQVQFAE